MANGDFKDLARRATSDNVLRNKAFNIAKNGYQGGLTSLDYNFFDISPLRLYINLQQVVVLIDYKMSN